MTRAIVAGMPKLRIEEAATRRQARIDRGEDVIVGVNKYRLAEETAARGARHRQHGGARGADPRGSSAIRARARRARAVERALARLAELARAGEGNLLEAAVEAARARATRRRDLRRARAGLHAPPRRGALGLGRLRAALPGRRRVRRRCAARSRPSPSEEGRRPRMLVVKLGQDGHDRGMKVIATAFADLGFDVDVGPLFQTPGGGRAPGDRERRARGRRVEPGGGPQDARAASWSRRCARRARGDIAVVVRRHHPAAGLRRSCASTAWPRSSAPARRCRRRRARCSRSVRDARA